MITWFLEITKFQKEERKKIKLDNNLQAIKLP